MFGKYKKPKTNQVDDYMKSIRDSNYSAGLIVGTQTAIDELRDIQNYDCINLTEEEKSEVMKYLTDNNLEFGYNVIEGGFYIMKKTKPLNNKRPSTPEHRGGLTNFSVSGVDTKIIK